MIKLTINDRPIEVNEGTTILKAATDACIHIPTLCYNEELTPIASCRLCVVEMIKDGESLIVSACDTLVTEGIKVYTHSEKALASRKYAVEILYSINPNVPLVKKLAEEFGITGKLHLQESDCIHCGRCAKVCSEVVGQNAIMNSTCGLSFGVQKPKLTWNFEKCIACGSCAFVCPTKAVNIKDDNGIRTLNTPNGKHEFGMHKCSKCGDYFAPNVQVQYMIKKTGLPEEKFDLCQNCR